MTTLPNWARWVFRLATVTTTVAVLSFLFQSNWYAALWAALAGGWQFTVWISYKTIANQARTIELLKNQPVVIEGVLFDVQDHCN